MTNTSAGIEMDIQEQSGGQGVTPVSAAATIECLLFAAAEPLTVEDLSRAAHIPHEDTVQALSFLQKRLTRDGSGLQVLQIA